MAERNIAGETYRVSPMPASEALTLLAEITRAAGPFAPQIPVIIAGAAGGEDGGAVADAALLAGISSVVASVGPHGVVDLIKRIVEHAEVLRPSGYGRVDLDGDFSDGLPTVVPVARFVLQETFGDFFPANAGIGLLAKLKAAFLTSR